MSKVAVVYFSQTGNTETMAHAVAEGAGTEAVEYDNFDAGQVAGYDASVSYTHLTLPTT